MPCVLFLHLSSLLVQALPENKGCTSTHHNKKTTHVVHMSTSQQQEKHAVQGGGATELYINSVPVVRTRRTLRIEGHGPL